ncbi:MAG: hypothetical protein A2W28_02390 [Gammaproteobacteria bacterium RBG_16_51_14]|nr:MAG: hypothetical protein A2W28_02390 [Gammaproteobacteria bacterium RBG_16_51_14]
METTTEKTGTNYLVEKFQQLINKAFSLDEQTLGELAGLAGKVISVEFINTSLVLYLFPSQQGIEIRTGFDGDVHVRIRGTPTALFAMVTANDGVSATAAGNMEIIGDVGLGQRFQAILMGIDIDWEELLSHRVGDSVAHLIGNLVRKGRRYMTDVQQTIVLDISEYLRYEKEVLPDRTVVDELVIAVDVMRDEVERMQLRLRKLEESIAGGY